MKQPDPIPASCESPLPACLLSRLASLSQQFTRPTWQNVLLLVTGAILAPGKRTVTAALRILGREQETDFPIYHGVLNRAVWSYRAVAGWLLCLLVATFVSAGATVVIGIDDTIERRWGHKISARGIYRDPVRSSKGHFVKTSGLRWLSAQLLVHIPWAGRIMALPFLTMLAPSKRFYAGKPRSPKTLLDCARQVAPAFAGAGSCKSTAGCPAAASCSSATPLLPPSASSPRFAVMSVSSPDCGSTPICYAPAPPKRPGRGRPPVKGKRLPKLGEVLHDANTVWQHHTVALWYGRTNRAVEIATGTAVWYHSGLPPVPIRWLLVRDPRGELAPQTFLCTDLDADPVDILQWFVSRWQLEVTFQESRAHLGVETQRQWSDLAIMRTTPALLGLFSLVTLWAHDLAARLPLAPRTAAWYPKAHCTFSDAIATVRRQIWHQQICCMSRLHRDVIEIPRQLWERAENALAYAA